MYHAGRFNELEQQISVDSWIAALNNILYNLSLAKGEIFMRKDSNVIRIFSVFRIYFGKRSDEARRSGLVAFCCSFPDSTLKRKLKTGPESTFNYFESQKAQDAERGSFPGTKFLKKKLDIVFVVRVPFRFMIGLLI